MKKNTTKTLKAQKCIYQLDNGAKCNSYALKDKQFCWRHSPEISDEEKRIHFSRGGKARWKDASESNGFKLPPIEINNAEDIVKLLGDTLNRIRDGSISQKFAASTAYVSMTLIMAMKESEAAKERKRIEELKTNGLWPEPVISPKKYVYKDKFYLDSAGKRYIEKDAISPFASIKPEDEEPQAEFENDYDDSEQ